MKNSMLLYLVLSITVWVAPVHAQASKYPPIDKYVMPQADEIALAKTAAPANISGRATVKVFTKTGSRSHNKEITATSAW